MKDAKRYLIIAFIVVVVLFVVYRIPQVKTAIIG